MSEEIKPSEMHRGLSVYINREHGKKVSPATVALVLRAYPNYLKDPSVLEAKEAEKRAREEAKAAKEAERLEKAKARLAKIEAERDRLLATLSDTEDFLDEEPEETNVVEIAKAKKAKIKKDPAVKKAVAEIVVEADDEFVVDDDDDDWDDDDEEDF